jgi:hypothetical protein
VKAFRVLQRLMGDRERERGGGHSASSGGGGGGGAANASMYSPMANLNADESAPLLEQERWLLGAGVANGDVRDELYCQVMKQLTRNPAPESVFKGWQVLCVLLVTFPPSKNFEGSVRAFIDRHAAEPHAAGRVDVMARHCLGRLEQIAKKGPRGKAPTVAEIECAAVRAPSPLFTRQLTKPAGRGVQPVHLRRVARRDSPPPGAHVPGRAGTDRAPVPCGRHPRARRRPRRGPVPRAR